MKILIAEDNAISQELLKKILVTRGHEVVVAGDGRVAWDLLCQGLKPDLAILDIMMPAMSGLEVLQRIRKDTRFKGLKTILCSALRDRETIAQGATLGIEYYILKPFKPDLVLQQVEKALVNAAEEITAPDSQPGADDISLLRSVNNVADEITRGLAIIKSSLAASALANGSAKFHNENKALALSPHFEALRNLTKQIETEVQQLRKKAPEINSAALAA
ncbi:MAG TPA: response regulator [Verrucomicrobiae bacterium]|jgi:CheY-like chemotaxis protein